MDGGAGRDEVSFASAPDSENVYLAEDTAFGGDGVDRSSTSRMWSARASPTCSSATPPRTCSEAGGQRRHQRRRWERRSDRRGRSRHGRLLRIPFRRRGQRGPRDRERLGNRLAHERRERARFDAERRHHGERCVQHPLGERGNDGIFGSGGPDYLFGGVGNDRIRPGLGDDRSVGGKGTDTIDLSSATGSVTITSARVGRRGRGPTGSRDSSGRSALPPPTPWWGTAHRTSSPVPVGTIGCPGGAVPTG